MVTIPIHQSSSEEIGDFLIAHLFSRYSMPAYMIINQDSVFMSTLINYVLRKLGIKNYTTTNHSKLNMELSF